MDPVKGSLFASPHLHSASAMMVRVTSLSAPASAAPPSCVTPHPATVAAAPEKVGRVLAGRHTGASRGLAASSSIISNVCNVLCSHLTLKVDPGRELDEGEVVVGGGGVVVRVLH